MDWDSDEENITYFLPDGIADDSPPRKRVESLRNLTNRAFGRIASPPPYGITAAVPKPSHGSSQSLLSGLGGVAFDCHKMGSNRSGYERSESSHSSLRHSIVGSSVGSIGITKAPPGLQTPQYQMHPTEFCHVHKDQSSWHGSDIIREGRSSNYSGEVAASVYVGRKSGAAGDQRPRSPSQSTIGSRIESHTVRGRSYSSGRYQQLNGIGRVGSPSQGMDQHHGHQQPGMVSMGTQIEQVASRGAASVSLASSSTIGSTVSSRDSMDARRKTSQPSVQTINPMQGTVRRFSGDNNHSATFVAPSGLPSTHNDIRMTVSMPKETPWTSSSTYSGEQQLNSSTAVIAPVRACTVSHQGLHETGCSVDSTKLSQKQQQRTQLSSQGVGPRTTNERKKTTMSGKVQFSQKEVGSLSSLLRHARSQEGVGERKKTPFKEKSVKREAFTTCRQKEHGNNAEEINWQVNSVKSSYDRDTGGSVAAVERMDKETDRVDDEQRAVKAVGRKSEMETLQRSKIACEEETWQRKDEGQNEQELTAESHEREREKSEMKKEKHEELEATNREIVGTAASLKGKSPSREGDKKSYGPGHAKDASTGAGYRRTSGGVPRGGGTVKKSRQDSSNVVVKQPSVGERVASIGNVTKVPLLLMPIFQNAKIAIARRYRKGIGAMSLSVTLSLVVCRAAGTIGVLFGYVLGASLSVLSWTLTVHRYAFQALSFNHHVALCYCFLYAFPSLVQYFIPWAPPWAPVCLWYAFLVQLFCTEGPPALVASFRLILPLLFLSQGVSHHSFLLDLNGGELLLASFILSALKTRSVHNPMFFLSLALQCIFAVFLGSRLIAQWCQLALALFSLLIMSSAHEKLGVLDPEETPSKYVTGRSVFSIADHHASPSTLSIRRTKGLDRRAVATIKGRKFR